LFIYTQWGWLILEKSNRYLGGATSKMFFVGTIIHPLYMRGPNMVSGSPMHPLP